MTQDTENHRTDRERWHQPDTMNNYIEDDTVISHLTSQNVSMASLPDENEAGEISTRSLGEAATTEGWNNEEGKNIGAGNPMAMSIQEADPSGASPSSAPLSGVELATQNYSPAERRGRRGSVEIASPMQSSRDIRSTRRSILFGDHALGAVSDLESPNEVNVPASTEKIATMEFPTTLPSSLHVPECVPPTRSVHLDDRTSCSNSNSNSNSNKEENSKMKTNVGRMPGLSSLIATSSNGKSSCRGLDYGDVPSKSNKSTHIDSSGIVNGPESIKANLASTPQVRQHSSNNIESQFVSEFRYGNHQEGRNLQSNSLWSRIIGRSGGIQDISSIQATTTNEGRDASPPYVVTVPASDVTQLDNSSNTPPPLVMASCVNEDDDKMALHGNVINCLCCLIVGTQQYQRPRSLLIIAVIIVLFLGAVVVAGAVLRGVQDGGGAEKQLATNTESTSPSSTIPPSPPPPPPPLPTTKRTATTIPPPPPLPKATATKTAMITTRATATPSTKTKTMTMTTTTTSTRATTTKPKPTTTTTITNDPDDIGATTTEEDDSLNALKSFLSHRSWDGGVALSTPGSPQESAMIWLMNDVRFHQMTESQKLQRYALATLYHALNGTHQWLDKAGWLTDANECLWFGIECDEGDENVVEIKLIDNGLEGTIVSELLLMKKTLKNLDLRLNSISGTVPIFLGSFDVIENMGFDSNKLTGTIPSALANLEFLRFLGLEQNKMTGTIPSELTRMKRLAWLQLGDNELVGRIPTKIGNVVTLTKLNIDNNLLTGPIPSNFWDNPNWKNLRLGMNSQLVGTLPTNIGMFIRLRDVSLNSTGFYGPVPQSIANIPKLRVFDISNTSMTGTIPITICHLLNTSLNRLAADCADPSAPKVDCSCCTLCS